MRGRPILRAVVLVSVATLVVSLPTTAPAQQLGGTETTLSVRTTTSVVAGEPVTFEWTYADPDAFTILRVASIDHGDGTKTAMEPGLRFPPCDELLYPTGAQGTFETFHVYEAPGTYEVVAQVTTRQQLCERPLSDEETAAVTITVEVAPAA